jgi:hypothetical protein
VGEILGVCHVTVWLPHRLSGEGIVETLPLPLNPEEQGLLRSSEVVCGAIASLD